MRRIASAAAPNKRAVLPRSVAVLHDPQAGLTHKGCWLKRLAGAFLRHSRARQPPQFGIDQRKNFGEHSRLAAHYPRNEHKFPNH
jgi:hypothetical protein